jgi:uncharacterized protein YneF (UPF0154 family)
MSILTIAFIVFALVDLTFVGTTTFFVVKLVKKVLNEKSVLEEIRKALNTLKKNNPRNFIERGQ